jgi:hypothetical protein
MRHILAKIAPVASQADSWKISLNSNSEGGRKYVSDTEIEPLRRSFFPGTLKSMSIFV